MDVFDVFVLSLTILSVLRNYVVGVHRLKVLNEIYRQGKRDINAGLDPMWRWNRYEKISHGEMLLKFWKPASSFFAGDPCVCPYEENMVSASDRSV